MILKINVFKWVVIWIIIYIKNVICYYYYVYILFINLDNKFFDNRKMYLIILAYINSVWYCFIYILFICIVYID